MRLMTTVCVLCGLGILSCGSAEGKDALGFLDNNLRCVDLSDLTSSVPLTVTQSFQVLWQTEGWEHNTFDRADDDSVGYLSVVKNSRGKNPDNKYYLYYAHHDPCSGIGCAVAEAIEGPYRKLARLDANRHDSIVLANPHYPIMKPPVGDPSHYSSPCVIWCEADQTSQFSVHPKFMAPCRRIVNQSTPFMIRFPLTVSSSAKFAVVRAPGTVSCRISVSARK